MEKGYSMAQAQRIILNSPARTIMLDETDHDFPALAELRRQKIMETEPTVLMEMAFSLGRAIGIRDERARRQGRVFCQPDHSEAERARKELRRTEAISLVRKLGREEMEAVGAYMTALAEGASNEDACKAGNAVLAVRGKAPVFSVEND